MNNPLSRANGPAKFYRHDTSTIPTTTYRKVRPSDFDDYLHTIGRPFEAYTQAQQHRRETQSASSSADTEPAPLPRTTGLKLDDVPRVFYQSQLDLTDPDQFRLVCSALADFGRPAEEIEDQARVPLPVIDSTFISRSQDHISQCLDTVELHLTHEISQRSDAFFAALDTLQNLHDETDKCIDQIHDLRGMLGRVSELHCGTGKALLRHRHRRTNLLQLQEAVRVLQEVRAVLDHATILVQQDDLIDALHLLCGAQEDVARFEEPTGDHAGLPPMRESRAYRELRRELAITTQTVSQSLEERVAAALAGHLAALWTDTETPVLAEVMPHYSDRLPRIATVSDDRWAEGRLILATELAPLVGALYRTGTLFGAVQASRDPLLLETRRILHDLWRNRFPQREASGTGRTPDTHGEPTTAMDGEAEEPWVREVSTMTFDRFLEWLFQMYTVFLLVIQYANAAGGALDDALAADDTLATSDVRAQIETELHATRDVLLDQAHLTCARAIAHRSDQTAQLDLKAFYRFYAVTWAYVFEMEEVTGKTCFGLRATLVSQSKAFLNHFHMERTKQLVVLIENDQWTQKGVPIDFQHMVDRIVESAAVLPGDEEEEEEERMGQGSGSSSGDHGVKAGGRPDRSSFARSPEHGQALATPVRPVPPLLVLQIDPEGGSVAQPAGSARLSHAGSGSGSTRNKRASVDSVASLLGSTGLDTWYADPDQLHSPALPTATFAAAAEAHGGGSGPADETHKVLRIRGRTFYVVGCSLMLLKMIIDYIQCATNIQTLATDVLHRVVEIFKLFNSRTCQVILGAGAMRSAGLKYITAKHIALASQSLGLVLAISPYVRDCLRQTLSAKQAVLLNEFDRILKDYREHQNELHLKLVAIMTERAQFHGKTIQATDWDVRSAGPQDFNPTPNMELLVKETKALHKVLGKYLPVETLQSVMSSVLRMYTQKLYDQIAVVEIHTVQGKQRLLGDVQYFIQRLSALGHVEPPGNALEVLVNNITVGGSSLPSNPRQA
ncbi:hypothetical protein IWQ60_002338 [Tieghemiomyces parasiticus]|uniref:Vacuolar protein sorting-associated protein 54 C-terminal domain-containing protein n=1 Tax=Tieghemiomyces parasiticus TaxID=78921 RepID=A0A9W8AHN3_9FUNG|nr:hypothetical protein IWQ60_002338 [Tieghemiomyces parasiticus]